MSMLDEPEDTLELGEEQQIIEPDDGDEPELLTFGDEADDGAEVPAGLAKHLRDVREELRIAKAELRQTREAKSPPEQPVVVGDKPTWESCEYDTDRYEQERDAWDDRRTKAQEQAAARTDAERRQQDEWGRIQDRYNQGKAKLRYADVAEAEETALGALSKVQTAVIAKYADDSARLIYALGKNPAQLAKLAEIDDTNALIKAMTQMEAKLTTRTSGVRPPDPERPVRGKPPTSGSSDKELTRLEIAAAKSGDRSEIAAYKARQMRK